MKVRFALLADFSNVTQEGKINVMGLFDFILASDYPVTHPEMQLIIRLEADITEQRQHKHVQVRLINERGEKIMELNGQIPVGEAKPGYPLINNQLLILRNITFPSAGDYQFDIYVDGSLGHSVPLKALLRSETHKP